MSPHLMINSLHTVNETRLRRPYIVGLCVVVFAFTQQFEAFVFDYQHNMCTVPLQPLLVLIILSMFLDTWNYDYVPHVKLNPIHKASPHA